MSLPAWPTDSLSFPRFPDLPPEIRQMIWLASAFPRTVYLEETQDESQMCSRVWSETSIDGPDSMGFFDLDHQSEAARSDQALRRSGVGTWIPMSIPAIFNIHTILRVQ